MAQGLFDRLQQELVAREKTAGVTAADLLELPPVERQLLSWLMRSGEVSASTVATHLGDSAQAQSLLVGLLARGFVREHESDGELYYQVRLAPRRQRTLPATIWQALTDKLGKKAGE
ncbi:MAG: hypothetical protein ACOYNY_35245 [Caldilineaceae bacterium]|jgi:hypothetical protein